VQVESLIIAGADASGFLAPVLEGIEAQVGLPGRLDLMADPEYPALVPERHHSSESFRITSGNSMP
jgi:hypothetical protein